MSAANGGSAGGGAPGAPRTSTAEVFVFLGPTLGPDEARGELDATYLPPVSQGDVYAVARRRPLAIGIVDGYFERMPSVWHKEILWAMTRGVHVFGAASMGALRAAELDAFGMVGVGEVFAAFRNGEIEDDDEVAVLHGPAGYGYAPLSEAMVNVRATVEAASDAGVLGADAKRRLLAAAKALHYRDRCWERILDAVDGVGAAELAALRDWLPQGAVDQKRLDAVAMLRAMRQLVDADPGPSKVAFPFHDTEMWQALRIHVDRRPLDDAPGADTRPPDAGLDELRLDEARYREARAAAIVRILALNVAQGLKIDVGAPFVQRDVATLRRRRDLEDDEAFAAWLQAQGLSPERFQRLVRDEAKLERVVELAELSLDVYLRDHLRLQGLYAELEARAERKHRRLSIAGLDSPGLADTGLSDERLWDWYFRRRCGREVPADLAAHAHDLGFEDLAAYRRAVVREYCYRVVLQQEKEAIDADS